MRTTRLALFALTLNFVASGPAIVRFFSISSCWPLSVIVPVMPAANETVSPPLAS